MRVLYVIDSLAPGGAETSLAEMAPSLISSGIELHVLPLADRMQLAPRLRVAGATVHSPAPGGGRLRNITHIIRVGRQVAPDLVHTTLYEADIAGRVAARVLGVPSSSSWVNQTYGPSHKAEASSLKMALARTVDRLTAPLAGRFHAVSQAVADVVGPALGIPSTRVEVIHRGRNPQRFVFRARSVRKTTREALGVRPGSPMILGVGRQEPQKGFEHLLRALPLVAQAHPSTVVFIAGRQGRKTEELKDLATSSPLPVRFLGPRDDIPALLAAADVLAFPSEREGSPGTLIEAMATGTPIVASDIGPCREVLGGSSPDTGLLVTPSDAPALAHAITSVLSDPHNAARRATMAHERFHRHFTIESVANKMVAFFDGAARQPSNTRRK